MPGSRRASTATLELANLAVPEGWGPDESETRTFLTKLSTTISLKNALDGLFGLRWFQNHRPGLLLVHQKGEAKAWQIGAGGADRAPTHPLEIDSFNALFTAAKKSKSGQFSTHPKWPWLPFGGPFLAEPYAFKRFNAILITTREEFLPFSQEEVECFRGFARIVGWWLEDLVEGEFSDLRLAEVMLLLDECPHPLQLQEAGGAPVFTNAAHQLAPPEHTTSIPLGQGYILAMGNAPESGENDIDVVHRYKIALLGDLFNTLGHELSNPLFGLALAADILASSPPDEDSRMMLQQVGKNIKRCQLILQNLSRLYSDAPQDASCDLGMVVREAVTLAKSELKGIRHTLEGVPPEGTTLKVEGRPVLVIQVLFNLLVNSAQALRTGGTAGHIRLIVHQGESDVAVEVSDNGPGLPPLVRENLFRPFTTTRAQGHGLGLALSRHLALQAGGNLEYLDPAEGAAFRLTLRRIL